MRNRFPIYGFFRSIKNFLLSLVLFLIASCAPAVAPSIPEPTATLAPTPTEVSSTNTVLYRGDAQRSGVFDFPAIRQGPAVQWQATLATTWLMPPVVAEGVLYAGSGNGVIYAVDTQTGEKLWSADGFSQLEHSGAVGGDLLIVGGYDGRLRALDRHSGDEVWSFGTAGFVQGSPLIVEDRVYAATDHVLYALDLATGKVQWQTATGNEGAFMGGPAYQDGIVYTTGGKSLLAVDSTSGKELWRIQHDDPFTALAVANGLIYVGNFDGSFYAFDQKDGAEKWNFQSSGLFWGAPAVDSDTVYTGNDSIVYALDAQSGEERWNFQMAGKAVSDPILSDGVVYVSDSAHEFPRGPRHLYALDASSGEKLWTFETTSTFLPTPALDQDTIYVTTTGDVIALR